MLNSTDTIGKLELENFNLLAHFIKAVSSISGSLC